jgi:hypothetical protein
LEKVKEMRHVSLVVSSICQHDTVYDDIAWPFIRLCLHLRISENCGELVEEKKGRGQEEKGLLEFDKAVEGSRVIGDPAKSRKQWLGSRT